MAQLQYQANTLSLPAAVPDGTQTVNARGTKYSDLYAVNPVPTKHMAALAGQYYTGFTTGGTAVVTSLTALTEASPALIIENTAPAGGVNILVDFVRLYATAIAAAGTDWQGAWKLDNIRNKWASGGATITPQNPNMGLPNASVAAVHAGALVVNAAQQSSSNARTLFNTFLKPPATAPAQIIGDTAHFAFGNFEGILPTVMSNVASAGANTFPLGIQHVVGPVVLMPGTTATLFLWGTANATAAAYNFTMGWYEY